MDDLVLRYDEDVDVLYMALGRPVAATVDDDDERVLVRLALSDGHPCGATIIGFKADWAERVDLLSEVIAQKLHVPKKAVSDAITHM